MQYKILLVDDDADDREFFIDAVTAITTEVEVVPFRNCNSLYSVLSESLIEFPDLIFLDINIPEIDGWACLSKLKADARHAHIPIIMYSTSNHQEDVMRAKKSGALCFCCKPYDFNELKKALNEVIDHIKKDAINELPYNSKIFI